MAFTLNVNTDVRKAAQSLKDYNRRKLPKALRDTLNRTIRGVRTDAKRELRKHIGMNAGEIAGRMAITYARGTIYRAVMVVRSRKIPNITSFKFSAPGKMIRGKARVGGKGVRATVWEKSKIYKGSFLWRRSTKQGGTANTAFKRIKGAAKVAPKKRVGGDGKIRKFKRGPKKGQTILRQPIKPVFGTSLGEVWYLVRKKDGGQVDAEVKVMAYARFAKEFDRQIARINK